jgi:hypothetical protein
VTERPVALPPSEAGGKVMGRKTLSPEQRLREKAKAFKRQAERLPYGREREELLLRARQLETASHIGKWISSPGLSPPT